MPSRCRYCRRVFTPSLYHPGQQVCTRLECQRARRNADHAKRRRVDPVYREQCREDARNWREANPNYQREYRQSHPQYVAANREAQRRRDRKRRLARLVKNNLAMAVNPHPARVWLVGPSCELLVKNNLAIPEVIMFQHLGNAQPCAT